MKCRLCNEKCVNVVIDFKKQPIVHNLQKNKESSYDVYSFRLGHCTNCGFLQLVDCIEPSILYQDYFTVSSWKNQPHVDRLVNVMECLCNLHKKTKLIDIGCNDGSFLLKLKEKGYNDICGIEPTTDASSKAKESNLNVEHSFFGEEVAKKLYQQGYFDIVIARQVLEHIVDLGDFLRGIEYILKDDGTLIIEIPDSSWNLETLDYGLWEEHVNCFTYSTANQLLSRYDFSIIHQETTLFSGRAITLFCEKRKRKALFRDEESVKIKKYISSWLPFKNFLNDFLESKDGKVAIYGCGARSSTLVNFTDIRDKVEFFIDDQKEKQDYYLPGSGLPIIGWKEQYRNYMILLGVNAENEYKVINKRGLDLKNTFSILPPSKLLPEFWKSMIND